MLDIKYIRENLAEVKKALAKKHARFKVDKLVSLDEKRRKLLSEIENLRAQRNKLVREKDIEGGRKIKRKLAKIEPKLKQIKDEFNQLMTLMHNIPDKSVPHYKEGSQIIRKWGEIPKFNFSPKTHDELGKILDIIDTERAAKVSGSRMGYLKNEAVILELALINYIFETLIKQGFIPMVVPVLVRERAMFGTGFFPNEKREYYKITEDDLYLVGTAEVPLCAYHADEILPEKILPLKYVGFSSCFRREAGSYGKDTYGIFRVHQFDKIEMFIFAHPKHSWQEFENLQKIVENILQELGLPYQVVNISGGDLGAPNAKKYDTEVWLPGQNKYRELTSCSHDTDFQARRLNIKFKSGGKEKKEKIEYVYTMNSTAAAIGRTIVAILENYQQKDGTVKIPKVLQKYCNLKEIKTKI